MPPRSTPSGPKYSFSQLPVFDLLMTNIWTPSPKIMLPFKEGPYFSDWPVCGKMVQASASIWDISKESFQFQISHWDSVEFADATVWQLNFSIFLRLFPVHLLSQGLIQEPLLNLLHANPEISKCVFMELTPRGLTSKVVLWSWLQNEILEQLSITG